MYIYTPPRGVALAPAYFRFPVHLKIKRGYRLDQCAHAVAETGAVCAVRCGTFGASTVTLSVAVPRNAVDPQYRHAATRHSSEHVTNTHTPETRRRNHTPTTPSVDYFCWAPCNHETQHHINGTATRLSTATGEPSICHQTFPTLAILQ